MAGFEGVENTYSLLVNCIYPVQPCLNFHANSTAGLLGRNGTGKTLSLLTLAGLRTPDAGEILLGTENLASMRRQQIARQLALLTQDTEDIFPATVMDTALIWLVPLQENRMV